MRLSVPGLLLLLFFFGCQSNSDETSALSDIPVFIPEEIQRIDSAGENYFSHLGYSSIVLQNGNVLLPDRANSSLYKIDESGEFIDIAAGKGRGPGEIDDITFLSESAFGEVLLYDQMTKKVVLLDEQGNYSDEMIFPGWEAANLTEVYALDENYFLMYFRSFDYLSNPEEKAKAHLVVYDQDQESYTISKAISDKPYSLTIRNGAAAGATMVPFAHEHVRAYDSQTGSLYLSWTAADEIVQINSALDTLQSFSANLAPQLLNKSELQDIKGDLNSESWKEMQSYLPEYKAIADKMLIDHNQNFWLKLNYESEFQQWLIVSSEGEHLQVVHLPKDVMLTHISKRHLGVRIDDVTFAFFEPVAL